MNDGFDIESQSVNIYQLTLSPVWNTKKPTVNTNTLHFDESQIAGSRQSENHQYDNK